MPDGAPGTAVVEFPAAAVTGGAGVPAVAAAAATPRPEAAAASAAAADAVAPFDVGVAALPPGAAAGAADATA